MNIISREKNDGISEQEDLLAQIAVEVHSWSTREEETLLPFFVLKVLQKLQKGRINWLLTHPCPQKANIPFRIAVLN